MIHTTKRETLNSTGYGELVQLSMKLVLTSINLFSPCQSYSYSAPLLPLLSMGKAQMLDAIHHLCVNSDAWCNSSPEPQLRHLMQFIICASAHTLDAIHHLNLNSRCLMQFIASTSSQMLDAIHYLCIILSQNWQQYGPRVTEEYYTMITFKRKPSFFSFFKWGGSEEKASVNSAEPGKLGEALLEILTTVHTGWPPRVGLLPDCFYALLLSALKQTHCTLVVCNSEWVTNFL